MLSALLVGIQLWGFPALGLWGLPVGAVYLGWTTTQRLRQPEDVLAEVDELSASSGDAGAGVLGAGLRNSGLVVVAILGGVLGLVGAIVLLPTVAAGLGVGLGVGLLSAWMPPVYRSLSKCEISTVNLNGTVDNYRSTRPDAGPQRMTVRRIRVGSRVSGRSC